MHRVKHKKCAYVCHGQGDKDLIAQADQRDPCIFAATNTGEWLSLVFEKPTRTRSQVGKGEDTRPEPEEDAGDEKGPPEIHTVFAVHVVKVCIKSMTDFRSVEGEEGGDEDCGGGLRA